MSQHIRREREIAWSEDNALNKKKELSEPDNPFPTGDTPVQNRKIPIFCHKYSDISGNNKFDACRTSLLTYRITTRISQQPRMNASEAYPYASAKRASSGTAAVSYMVIFVYLCGLQAKREAFDSLRSLERTAELSERTDR